MNHCVPNFQEIEDDFSIPTSSGLSMTKKPVMGQEDVMELLWQNGQVVAQTQKLSKKTNLGYGGEVEQRESVEDKAQQQHLFMQEDEMASWLQYPLDVSSFDRDLYADLLYSAPTPSTPVTTPRPFIEIRPPHKSPILSPPNPQRLQNFLHISKIPTRNISTMMKTPRELTIVESNETPMTAGRKSIVSHPPVDSETNIPFRTGKAPDVGDLTAAVSSSPSCSGASFSTSMDRYPPPQKPAQESMQGDRKRRSREADDNNCLIEDTEFEAIETKKQCHGSTSTKKSRASQVHNLSERRRRDRINEKMRVLQELIPRCNKSDKASMLDEAIEYLKSLQLQVQMMSMGCGMVPIMYPGMQQYMPPMMGMMPYPSMLPNTAMSNPNMNPCFSMPQLSVPDISRVQASDSMLNQDPPRMTNINPFQQFFGLHQSQPPFRQNQAAVQPNISSNRNPDSHQIG